MAWVIRRADGCYADSGRNWSSDPSEAFRFDSREDAANHASTFGRGDLRVFRRRRKYSVTRSVWLIDMDDATYLANTSNPDALGYMRSASGAKDPNLALQFASEEAAKRVQSSQPAGGVICMKVPWSFPDPPRTGDPLQKGEKR